MEAALRALALDTCKDVRIGDPLNRGISGSQRSFAKSDTSAGSNDRVASTSFDCPMLHGG